VDDFVKDILERDIDELMKAILICSEAKCVKTDKLNDKIISSFEEEKALLGLAKNLQCTIENKARAQETRVKIKMRNSMLDEVIVGLSESQENTGKLSVVACPLRKDGSAVIDKAYLYVKGPFNLVRPILGNTDVERLAMLDLAAEKISKHGTVPFLFAKKRLGKEEARLFAKNYRNIKANLTMQDYSIDSMFTDLEKDLEIVGMCGLEKQCFLMIQDTLKTLEQTGINKWIVSNESLEKMLVQLNTYNLYKINDYQFYVNASTSETVAIQIKQYMSDFQRIYEIKKKLKNQAEIGLKGGKLMESYKELSDDIKQQMKKYTILVSGKSLDLIMRDSSTYEHFAFLSYLVGKVVGFNFTPDNKRSLVSMIKDKFAQHTYVMCIGTNYTDLSMIHVADIGVIVTNFRKDHKILPPWGDIIVSDLTKVKHLLLKNGIKISHQIDSTLYYLFYKSIAITLPLFYFNWFSTMTGTSIYDSVLLFLLFFLFTTLPLIAFSFEKPFSLNYAFAYPGLYSESRYKKTHLFKKFILRAVLEGCIHSTVIFYIGLYHVGRSMSPEGLTADLVMVSLFFVISLVFVINFKLFFSFSSNSIVFWTGIIWSLTFLFGFIWVNVSASFTETMYSGLNYQLDELVGRLTTLFCFFLVILFCLAFSYVIQHYVLYKDLSSAWNILKNKYKKGDLDEDLTNNKILQALDESL
jgi:phospholipid-translocating ATPase